MRKPPRLPATRRFRPKLSEARLHNYTVDLLSKLALPNVLWLHIPMGVKSAHGAMAGKWARAMGARPGASDFLLVKDGEAYFLELKAMGGRMSREQQRFTDDAAKAGAGVYVARSPEEVTSILDNLGMLRAATIAA